MLIEAQRPAVVAAGAVLAVVGLVGLAHAPFARALLLRLGGCPMAGSRISPEVADHARRVALGEEAATAPAPARPALGFELDSTTLPDARAWADREHVDCADIRPGLIRCTGVGPEALGLPSVHGRIDELALEFDPRDRLVNMTTLRTHLTPQSASVTSLAIVGALAEKLGPAVRRAGDFQASSLAARSEGSISTVRYRFTDYVADVTAMNLPSLGPSIREHYMSARD